MGRDVTCDTCGAEHLLLAVNMVYRCATCRGEHYICGKCRWDLDLPIEEPPLCAPEYRVASALMRGVG